MILLIGPGQPADPVGQWLKPTGRADVMHQVIWRRGDELRTGCRVVMDARRAMRPALGARFCEACWENMRAKDKYARDKRRRR